MICFMAYGSDSFSHDSITVRSLFADVRLWLLPFLSNKMWKFVILAIETYLEA